MYNRSVWFEQVDQALYDLLKDTVYTYGDDGTVEHIVPSFPLTDEELKTVKLPTAIIKKENHEFDLFRYDKQDQVVGYNSNTSNAIVETSAMPYTLNYQIDFLANYQEDINQMTRVWAMKIPKRYMLGVKDMSGNPRQCYMRQTSPIVTMNELKGDAKLYRICIKYAIWVELDEGTQRITKVASNVGIVTP